MFLTQLTAIKLLAILILLTQFSFITSVFYHLCTFCIVHYVSYSFNCVHFLAIYTYFTNTVQLLSVFHHICISVLYHLNQDLHEKLQLLQMQYFLW